MARHLRIQVPDGWYHVTSRGHERGRIFADDTDRETFLDVLAQVVGEKRWLVHGYCLMTNHVHLLVETPAGNLSSGMQNLSGRYSQAYNRRHGRGGQHEHANGDADHSLDRSHVLSSLGNFASRAPRDAPLPPHCSQTIVRCR